MIGFRNLGYNTRRLCTMSTSGVHSVVFITAPSMEVAKNLAGAIVNEDLAACVSVIPKVISVFKWEGKITEEMETFMIAKTRTSRVDDLIEFVKNNHPYDVCEVISTKIDKGNGPYLDWISSNVPESAVPHTPLKEDTINTQN